MKKTIAIAVLLCVALIITACGTPGPQVFTSPSFSQPTTAPTTEPTTDPSTEPTTEHTEPTEPPKPEHSELYIEGLNVDDVITYFKEVCLDAEYSNGGDPSLVQKWIAPIRYSLDGDYTQKDLQVLSVFSDLLNSVEGFPGIRQVKAGGTANMQIHFCTQETLVEKMGSNFADSDGTVTYWYDDNNNIYKADINIRTDIDQETRNSVIQEEIYNGLGATQDTLLRKDSLIYQEYSIPQEPTPVDMLIIKLLYSKNIRSGMNEKACTTAIRELYY